MGKPKKRKTSRRRATFVLDAPHAHRVSLVGDFNNWDPQKHPMNNKGEGRWQKAVMLDPGTYEYKFWVDEQWLIDNRNAYRCPNTFGTMNSLITVSP